MTDIHNAETVLSAGHLIKGRYRLLGLLGGGGFGTVYLAEDVDLGNRRTVVKVLNRKMLAEPALRRKFDDEKRALIKLSARNHPGIADIYDSGELPDKTPFLVMQYVPGVTLANRLEELRRSGKRFGLEQVAAILEQLGDALAVAHEEGVLHRDVKPSNILLTRQSDGREQVTLIDFGIARPTGGAKSDPLRTVTGVGMGTVAYAAPEQFNPKREVKATCDVYAFTVVAFELLAGRLPFEDVGWGAALEEQRRIGLKERVSALRPEVPVGVDALLEEGLRYEPERRPGDIRAFSKRLAEEVRGAGEGTRRVASSDQTAARRQEALGQSPPRLPTTLPAGDVKPDLTGWIQEQLGAVAERGKGGKPPTVIRFVAFALVIVLAGVAALTGVWVREWSAGRGDAVGAPSGPPPAGTRAGQVWESPAGLRLAWVPAGTFEMGSNNGWDNEKPVHRVTLTQGFWLGETEVTQAQWEAVMGSNPSYFKGCPECPVEWVSWEDCQAFVRRLNERYPVGGGLAWRLPREAEWEYACRAGTRGDYYDGDGEARLGALGWYAQNSGGRTNPVKRKRPNGWGLYDMHGNVWEWCEDWYKEDYYRISPVDDPRGPGSGEYRVVRGGSWNNNAPRCRAANRANNTPTSRYNDLGLRVAVGAP